MRVQTEQRMIMRGGDVAQEHNFTIKASAKAFSVLASNLYSDKPLAIVRELSANAFDSHVAAGKADVPFEIHLPNRLNPTLTIRDFGTGLDHEGITKIYATFFESTKTESNDFIGQLGLGSKSPLSMFKTFTVEARKDGIQRIYTVFINEDGIPTLAKMSETETTEQNGIAVSMHVRPDDFSKFHTAAQRALMYYNPLPIVNGDDSFEVADVQHGIGTDAWKVRNASYWSRMNGPYVVQGAVVYPIDPSIVNEMVPMEADVLQLASMNIDYWMPIGSVDVAPSREALSYDKRTCQNLVEAFKTATNDMRGVIQAEFEAMPTKYDAARRLYDYYRGHKCERSLSDLVNKMFRMAPFTYKGEKLDTNMHVVFGQLADTTIGMADVGRSRITYNWKRNTDSKMVDVDIVASKMLFVIDDVRARSTEIIKEYARRESTYTVVVIKPVSKNQYNQAEIDSLVKQFGGAEFVKLSSLPYAELIQPTRTKRSLTSRKVFMGFPTERSSWRKTIRRVFSRLTWDTVEVDLSQGGYYIELDGYKAVYEKQPLMYLDDILNGAVSLGLISAADTKTKVYGFTKKEIETAPANWVNLFDYIKTMIVSMDLENEYIRAMVATEIKSHMHTFNQTLGGKVWDSIAPQITDGMFKRFVEKVNNQTGIDANADYYKNINTLLEAVNCNTRGTIRAKARLLTEEWDTICAKHSMLELIDWSLCGNQKARTMIVDYINALNIQ